MRAGGIFTMEMLLNTHYVLRNSDGFRQCFNSQMPPITLAIGFDRLLTVHFPTVSGRSIPFRGVNFEL